MTLRDTILTVVYRASSDRCLLQLWVFCDYSSTSNDGLNVTAIDNTRCGHCACSASRHR